MLNGMTLWIYHILLNSYLTFKGYIYISNDGDGYTIEFGYVITVL